MPAADILPFLIGLRKRILRTAQHSTNAITNRPSKIRKNAGLAYMSGNQGGELLQEEEAMYHLGPHYDGAARRNIMPYGNEGP